MTIRVKFVLSHDFSACMDQLLDIYPIVSCKLLSGYIRLVEYNDTCNGFITSKTSYLCDKSNMKSSKGHVNEKEHNLALTTIEVLY